MIYVWFIFVCCIAVILFLALVAERRERIDAEMRARRFCDERDGWRKDSSKRVAERDAALEKVEILEAKTKRLESAKDAIAGRCEELLGKLSRESLKNVFSDWECVRDVEGMRDFYLEKDGIRLIFEHDKCIGWYCPIKSGTPICLGECRTPVYEVPEATAVKDFT